MSIFGFKNGLAVFLGFGNYHVTVSVVERCVFGLWVSCHYFSYTIFSWLCFMCKTVVTV